jgi:hypothetical protein
MFPRCTDLQLIDSPGITRTTLFNSMNNLKDLLIQQDMKKYPLETELLS